jgi:3-deoxy-manno-octulosonate cytidylyltransferase (CMP-KDO synthetase)
MDTVVVIPARYGSTRFPGKPLVSVAGKSLLERVWRIGQAVSGVDSVVVATDDERLRDHARSFGADVVMTPTTCRNGTERTHAAITSMGINPRIVVNLQGDAVLTPPWIISALVDEMSRNPEVRLATPAVQLEREAYESMVQMKGRGIVSGTTVTFNVKGDAMYFSKGIIPFIRALPDDAQSQGITPVYQHIGLYAFTSETLSQYVALPPGQFESVEQLEQLRALEHGIPVRVVKVSMRGRTMWSIDNPEDVARTEEIISREGELI